MLNSYLFTWQTVKSLPSWDAAVGMRSWFMTFTKETLRHINNNHNIINVIAFKHCKPLANIVLSFMALLPVVWWGKIHSPSTARHCVSLVQSLIRLTSIHCFRAWRPIAPVPIRSIPQITINDMGRDVSVTTCGPYLKITLDELDR